MAKRSLESGAQDNAVQHGGWTPLHQAAAHGNLEMVDLLLDYGADLAMRSDDGRTALMMAEDSQHVAVIRRLAGNKDGSK
jgi:ankyrin repeat protein